jgi:phosphoglycolate phosphatase-like HAD superfamily hydrolase
MNSRVTHPKRAFIVDMDDTIVDNMAVPTRSWLTFFQQRGHAHPDVLLEAARRAAPACAPSC